ncbi:hypothetical protein ACFL43_05740 [Thermodesulfobacteriota bacterium]
MTNKKNAAVTTLCACMALVAALALWRCDLISHIPAGLETYAAADGTTWQRVSEPGFGDEENVAVVALREFQNRLYAMVRNDVDGVEVWRTAGNGWEQVLFPNGSSNGVYGNHMINTHIGALMVFKDKLYCAFSSGVQGSYLKSSGAEIWRYDGSSWEPAISDKKDVEEQGTITAIVDCSADDSAVTASVTDSSKAWEVDRWAGGILQITSGEGIFRRFDIISNNAGTLLIQQNEIAGERDTEYTICESSHYVNPFPPHAYDLGAVSEGDTYEIGTGNDENGFGQYFNKAISNMTVFNGKLYATTILNYDFGGQVWYTEDGDTWSVTQPPNSLGLFHTDEKYPDDKKPVTRGISSLGVCDVSGAETLYAGSLGSSGNLGNCARMARLTDSGWEMIVDAGVDANDNGTNENGFGDGMECGMFDGNFNLWSQACFDGKLFAGIHSLAGARVLYSTTANTKDGSWVYSVGGNADLPAGFDGEINAGSKEIAVLPNPIHQTMAANLFAFGDQLYAGLIRLYMPEFGATEEYLTGSQIWKTPDGDTWEQVTADGFGDVTVLGFEAFAAFGGRLYVAASRAANTVGGGLGGATIYRLEQ